MSNPRNMLKDEEPGVLVRDASGDVYELLENPAGNACWVRDTNGESWLKKSEIVDVIRNLTFEQYLARQSAVPFDLDEPGWTQTDRDALDEFMSHGIGDDDDQSTPTDEVAEWESSRAAFDATCDTDIPPDADDLPYGSPAAPTPAALQSYLDQHPADQSADSGDMVDLPEAVTQLITDMQIAFQKQEAEIADLSKAKFAAERAAASARDELAKVTTLPRLDEFTALRADLAQLQAQLAEARKDEAYWKQQLEQNREGFSKNWKTKYKIQSIKLQDAKRELAQLRQPSLLSDSAPLPVAVLLDGKSTPVDDVLTELFRLRQDVREQDRLLQIEQRKRFAEQPDAPAGDQLETRTLVQDLEEPARRPAADTELAQAIRDGWTVASESVLMRGASLTRVVRLERRQSTAPVTGTTSTVIDRAIAAALATGPVAEPEMTIIGLDPEPEPVTTGDPFRDALRSGITDPATLAAIGNQQLLNIAETAFNRVAAVPAPSRPFKPFALLTVKD